MHTLETRARAWDKMKRLRDKWLHDNGPCQHCGSWVDLEMHHREPKDKISNSVWSWEEIRRNAELAKCEVLCKTCHRSVTTYQQWAGHGHIGTYKNGCRCLECRVVKAVENSKRVR